MKILFREFWDSLISKFHCNLRKEVCYGIFLNGIVFNKIAFTVFNQEINTVGILKVE